MSARDPARLPRRRARRARRCPPLARAQTAGARTRRCRPSSAIVRRGRAIAVAPRGRPRRRRPRPPAHDRDRHARPRRRALVDVGGQPLEVAVSPDGRARRRDDGLLGRARARDRRPRAPARCARASTSGRRRSASPSRRDGRRIVVSGGEQEGTVHVVDARSASRSSAQRRSGSSRAASRLRPTATPAWVALNGRRPASSRVDLRSGRVARDARARRALPDRVAISPDGAPPARLPRRPRRRARQRDRRRAPGACGRHRAGRLPSGVAWTPRGRGSSRSAAPARSSCSAAAAPAPPRVGGCAARPGRRRQPRLDRRRADGRGRDGGERRERPPTAASCSRARAGWPAAAGLAGLGGGALAGAAAAAAERRPNVLILMTDQERHQDRLPDDLPTPGALLAGRQRHADRPLPRLLDGLLAVARVLLDRDVRAAAGHLRHVRLGTQFTMDPSIPTIGDLFKELGYRTAFFGKWHLSFPGEPPTNLEAALDTRAGQPAQGLRLRPLGDLAAGRRRRLQRRLHQRPGLDRPGGRLPARRTPHDEQPWLCVLSLLNPHDIQFYPRGFRADFKRPDYDAEARALLLRRADARRQADRASSASATSSAIIAGHAERASRTTRSTGAASSTPTTT